MVGFQQHPASDPSQLPNGYPIRPDPAPRPATHAPAGSNNSSFARTIEVIDITDLPNGITPISSQQPCQDTDDEDGAVQSVSAPAAVAGRGLVVEPEGGPEARSHHSDQDDDAARRYSPSAGVRTGVDGQHRLASTAPQFEGLRSSARLSGSESPSVEPRRRAHDGLIDGVNVEGPREEQRAPEEQERT